MTRPTIGQRLMFILICGVFATPFIMLGFVWGVISEAFTVGVWHATIYVHRHVKSSAEEAKRGG